MNIITLTFLETYPHGTAHHNKFHKRNVKMSKKKMRDCRFGEQKTSSMFNDTPLLLNKAIDMAGTSSTLFPYTVVDSPPGIHSDNNAPSTCSLNTVLSTCTIDNNTKTYIADSLPDVNTTDTITSSSEHAPSPSTSNATPCSDTISSAPGPSRITQDPATSDGTQKSSNTKSTPSYISESDQNIFISENAHIPSSINNVFRPSGAASISNNTGTYTEDSHGKTENNVEGENNKKISSGKQRKNQSSNAVLKSSPKDNGRKNIPSYNLEVSENSDSEVIYEQIEPICSSSCSKSLEDNLQWHSPGISLRWPPTRHQILTESLLYFSCNPEPENHLNELLTNVACVLQAVNMVGVGMFGGTGKVTTPGTVPAIVPMLQEAEDKVPAKLSSSCIAIQWEEPDCHGSPITGYNIEYGDKKILTVDRVTEYVLKNLQPNTTYR
ncbi:Fibronectin type III domain containing protein 3C1 [Lemmus lemmus]